MLSLVIFALTSVICFGASGSLPSNTQSTSIASSTDYWRSFRHDFSNTGVSSIAGPSSNQTLWIHALPSAIRSSAAVFNNILYVGTFGGYFSAINASTGNEIWNFTASGDIWSSPAVFKGIVYFGDNTNGATKGSLYALDAYTGVLKWNFTSGDSIYGSPAVANGAVYFGDTDNKTYALNENTGALLWTYTTGGQIRTTPAVVGNTVYIASEDGKVYALNAQTGALIWSYQTIGGGTYMDSSPIVVNGVLYIGDDGGYVYAIDASTGKEIWSYQASSNKVSSTPAVSNDILYVGCEDDYVYAINITNGSLVWKYQTNGAVYSSPSISSGVIYVSSFGGTLYALSASDGSLVWSYSAGSFFASSALADGALFVGDYDSNLYAFGNYTPGQTIVDTDVAVASSSAWTPTPSQAAISVSFAAVVTGVVSAIFSTTSAPAGAGFWVRFVDYLKGLIPDSVKKWFEDFVASKNKAGTKKKASSIFKISKTEIVAYIILLVFLTLAFSYVKVPDFSLILTVLPIVLGTSIIVALVKKYFTIAYIRHKGVHCEHRFWPLGFVLFVVTAFAFRSPFSSPTRNVKDDSIFSKHIGVRTAAFEIIISLLFALSFFILYKLGFALIGGIGLSMCIMSALFDAMPFTPMSGRDIIHYSKKLWLCIFLVCFVSYILWLIFL